LTDHIGIWPKIAIFAHHVHVFNPQLRAVLKKFCNAV